ncbi:uncharacterized protein [Atheta coriaria]|uniref:uncharacterized protein n=1 Tax=Dalotia coriaria TaxID=877792 RepID=UPI0031F3F927
MKNMKWLVKLTAILFAVTLLANECCSCPTACVCKWKNGKQTVECGDKGLLIIPEGMDTGTQVLEFNGNNLRTLHREKFLKMDLINLQRIYLARCHILVIEPGTFKGLTNLVELDLTGNAMEVVPTAAFLDCPSLMKLTLSANPIKIIHREAFGHLYFLHTLELSGCQLEKVESGAFDGLQSLERLRLDSNQLTTIDGASTLSKHLQEVDLQGNQWQCDCRMVEMRSWLEGYELPTSVAPMCAGPPRLAKRPVKSIPRAELACLPDVTPTTFYLEIAEGKNISLRCQISAVPEAHVSWWFQGQLLQNDTMLTPDTRLIYYVEEGGEDKRSELFIYNTNPEDNGTFICVAENTAGAVQSNFTIRIILKDVPGHELAQLPFEFVLIIVSATGVSLLVICFALILSIIKCHSENRRRKKEHASQNLVLSHSTKDSLLQESVEEFSELSKESSDPSLVQGQQMMMYSSAQTSEELLRSMSPILAANQLRSPASCYQPEQNPDLISDAEALGVGIGKRHDGDGEDKHEAGGENFELSSSNLHQQQACYLQPVLLPPVVGVVEEEQRSNRDLYRLSADVHLNPVGLLNAANFANGSCYRTLPYNRGVKRQASLQETHRYHRDAEFASPHAPRLSFEHFHPANVRYTADGYPARGGGCCDAEQETQFSDTESLRSCCSAPAVPWLPHAVATPLVSILKHPITEERNMQLKKCVVGTQTQTDITALNTKPVNRTVAMKIAETLTESPDEGYEGEENQTKI